MKKWFKFNLKLKFYTNRDSENIKIVNRNNDENGLRGHLSVNDSVYKLYDLISSWLPKAFQNEPSEEKEVEFISRQISSQVSDAPDLVEASEWIRKVR